MRRPFVVMGLTLYISLSIAVRLSLNGQLVMTFFLVFLVLISCLLKIRNIYSVTAVLFSAALGFGLCAVYTQTLYLPATALAGSTQNLTGQILDRSVSSSGKYSYTLEIDDRNLCEKKFRVLLYVDAPLPADYDDTISVQAELYQASDSLRSRSIFLTAYATNTPTITTYKGIHSPLYFFRILRDQISSSLDKLFSVEVSGLLHALLLGDKSRLSSAAFLVFRRAGLAHVLAVSGLHLTILLQFFLYIFRAFKMPARLCSGLAIPLVLCFMALTGFSISVLRAGIMSILFHFAILIGWESDGLNSLGLAATLILLFQPYAVQDLSFLLSFYATAGILLFSEPATRKVVEKLHIWNKYVKSLIGKLCVSFAAMAAVLPISLFYFSEYSVWAPISGLFAEPLLILCLLFGFLSAILGIFLPILGQLAAWPALWGAEALQWITETTASLPFSKIPLGSGFIKLWCLCMLLLIGGAYLLSAPDRRGPVVRLSCLLSVILLLFASLSKLAFTHNVAELVVLHEGEDTSVILLYDRHASVLFCNGNSRMGDITADFLLSRGILRLDCMFFSDSGYTTQKSVLSLAEQIPVSTIFCPEPAKIKSAFAKQQADISFLSSAECQVSLTENISISSAATSGGTVCLLSIWDHTLSLAPSQYAASYFQRTATSEKAPDILLLAGKISSFLESLDFDLALILEEQTYALQTSGEIVPAFFGDQTSLLLRSNGQYQVVQTEMEAFHALFE